MYKHFFKRIFDILVSGLALVLLLPVLIILAILVRIKLGSPIIFEQKRPGKDNAIFRMHKFRTMTEEKDEEGNLLPDEVRLTKFGRFLRSTSLDELPELWDIFRGKMSLIGPRPQLVRDLVFMDENQIRRHTVRPGLTGYAQVNGRNNQSWEQRFEYDLFYVDNLSLGLDIKIFFQTISKVIKGSDVSTEGMATSLDFGDCLLAEGKVTAEEYAEKQAQAKETLARTSHKF